MRDGRFNIKWLDTGKREAGVSRERLALAVSGLDDHAALAAAGWRAEWVLPPPASTMHPPFDGAQETGRAEITLRRSLHDSKPEADFGERTLHTRWLEERADADPVDFAELQNNVDSAANSRAEALERRLTQQAQEQQQAMDAKIASLEEKMERLRSRTSDWIG
eukprot:COSAG06_NODE_445_length_15690_cov_28.448849_2_plen_164_part_00